MRAYVGMMACWHVLLSKHASVHHSWNLQSPKCMHSCSLLVNYAAEQKKTCTFP